MRVKQITQAQMPAGGAGDPPGVHTCANITKIVGLRREPHRILHQQRARTLAHQVVEAAGIFAPGIHPVLRYADDVDVMPLPTGEALLIPDGDTACVTATEDVRGMSKQPRLPRIIGTIGCAWLKWLCGSKGQNGKEQRQDANDAADDSGHGNDLL
jgi:hypothetical protein